MDWTCSGKSDRFGIWGIWRPGQLLELTAHVKLLLSIICCDVEGCVVLPQGSLPLEGAAGMSGFTLSKTMLEQVLFVKKHPNKCQYLRFLIRTLHCREIINLIN